ncbi:Clathrin coat assembly protein-like protein [Hapsidospora chrysogenum ATCC 11550]|uniref:Clathrin coat assembly protein-like protein n=1 Tax=Hapsidospora chrysogenum (strain ATCC 11550 / CBS 779.69 / DSM 880 / IAM 14645 / JCM 23072 / IMI 49137) TaxID=857340 RepID=A0A086T4X9_HAPC1|nr:Clathrin coat assembly protein-like protein [Hapsidospora chrysogenum ATCC 11550]
MSSSFEKSVKGATKIKNAPPKTKYIEHILVATHSGEAGIAEVIRALQYRLRDATWTVVFKSLITVHLMIREGSPDVTLAYLSKNRNSLAISNFTDGPFAASLSARLTELTICWETAVTQGRNIRHYAGYLSERTRSYRDTRTDWVRVSESKLEHTPVEKGLLRQTESVQRQLGALLKCDILNTEPENEITITAFRLLVLDLLALFQVANQGLINILGHFFEMTKTDAERAMDIYRTFTRQTELVVAYLSVARQHEHHTRVQVPKLKHAPVHLARQLEEYLNDPDFDINRRQYIAEQSAKGKLGSSSSKLPSKKPDNEFPTPAANNPFPKSNGSRQPTEPSKSQPESKPQANKGADPDLIDFFDSIEQNQTTMPTQPSQLNTQPTANPMSNGFQQQPTGMPFHPNNGFIQTQPTGFQPNSGFVQAQPTGFSSNPYQQQAPQQQPQPNSTFDPFQTSQIVAPQPTGAGFGGFTPQQQQQQQQQGFQPGNLGTIPQNTIASFQNQGLQPAQTGQPGFLQPTQTGTTNPFRQSMLMAQQTGIQTSPPQTASPPAANPLNRQSTNPFVRSPQSQSPYNSGSNSPFQSLPQQQPPAPLQATPTGTNPFARNRSPPSDQQRPNTAGGALAPQPTGSTNPFRQSAFVNHNTGQGWQHNQQPIGGGLDQLPTQPVFPRPAQQSPWQQ